MRTSINSNFDIFIEYKILFSLHVLMVPLTHEQMNIVGIGVAAFSYKMGIDFTNIKMLRFKEGWLIALTKLQLISNDTDGK